MVKDFNVDDMNVRGAVALLNKYKHNFDTANIEDHHTIKWIVEEDPHGPCYASLNRYVTDWLDDPCAPYDNYQALTEFEAVAIVKEYIRRS